MLAPMRRLRLRPLSSERLFLMIETLLPNVLTELFAVNTAIRRRGCIAVCGLPFSFKTRCLQESDEKHTIGSGLKASRFALPFRIVPVTRHGESAGTQRPPKNA